MSDSSQVRRFMARVEFIACMEEVESMLRQGFSKQLVYERLKEEGRISMAYVTFAKLIFRAARNDLPLTSLTLSTKSVEHPALPQTVEKRKSTPPHPQRQPGIISTSPQPMQDPRNIDPKTII